MGRHLDLGHLSEEECERILQVIQRDFDLRQKEKGRLGKIDEDIKEEDSKVSILAKQKQFNENCCMRCFSRFFFIFNQKVQCHLCQYFICKNCSTYDNKEKQYICNVCTKQRELETQSCDWFYSNIKKRFKRFGSAKVVRSLYKRKTESDSENDSGYDPSHYSNSLPVGRRSRQTIEGFFTGLDKPLTSTDYIAMLGLPDEDGEEYDEDEDEEEEEESEQPPHPLVDVLKHVQERHELNSCAVADSQQSFETARDEKGERFKKDLNDIINDFHRTLENQTPGGLPNGDTSGGYERLLESERLQITNTVSNLRQSLLLSLESQPGSVEDGESTEDRHRIVRDAVVKEVETYVGHPVTVGDDRLQNGSTTDHQGAYEEVLVDAIIDKILADHKKIEDQRHLHEEEKVRKDLTKLSNQCTITQLTDLLSTDTETDDAHNSTFNTDTDTESVLSTYVQPLSTPREDNTVIQTQSDAEVESDLDDLVAINSESAEEYQRTKLLTSSSNVDNTALRMSVSSAESSDMIVTVTSPTGETFDAIPDDNENNTAENKITNDLNKENGNDELVAITATELQSQNIGERVTSESESDATLEAEDDALLMNGSPPDEGSLRFAMERRIPLPSFDDTDGLGIKEVDLDDISRQSDVEDDDVSMNATTLDSEISFGNSWNVSQPGPLFKDRISAYDNFGERKVGKDDHGPVFMLVPDGSVQSPRIGEKDLDELSDLSENSSKSDLSSYDSDERLEDTSEEEGEEYADNVIGERKERKKKTSPREMSDFAVQTDDLYFSQTTGDSAVKSEANVEQEYITLSSSSLRPDANSRDTSLRDQRLQQKLEEEEDKEDEEEEDSEDRDPRFVVRPKTITCPVGEVARFTCQVDGTKPLDVFWYKEGAEVEQLEDGERYDVSCRDNRHTLDIFNTSVKDRGRYFCIAINEHGQNHKTFRLRLTDNSSDKAAPEFLKPIQDVEAMCGMTVSFRCKLRGYPQPRVLWYRDGKLLRNSDQIRILKQGNRDHLLSIEYVTMDDDAEYTVVARNIAGEARSSAQLLVEEKTDATSRKYAELESASVNLSRSSSKASYPETEELLRIAEQVRSTRTDVTTTANIVPRSANKLSSIHSQLDEMDAKLNNLEDEVHDSMFSQESFITEDGGDRANNNGSHRPANTYQPANNSLRQAILREHDDMRTSAQSLRRVTNTALEVLTSTSTLLQSDTISPATTPTSPLRDVISVPDPDLEEQVEDLHLTYADFELLYRNGKITKEQLKSGKVSRKDGERLLADLEELKVHSVEEAIDRSHDLSAESLPTSIDCGLKRVPSKRYKRDFIVNRSPQVTKKKWNVQTPSPLGTEVVRPLPGGTQDHLNDAEESEYNLVPIDIDEGDYSQQEEEVPPSWIQHTNSAEDEVYMSASRVYTLEDRIKQLEGRLDQEEISDHQLEELEDQVARTVGQVKNSDAQVMKVEQQVRQLRQSFSSQEPHNQSKSSESSINQSVSEQSFSNQSANEQSFLTESETSMKIEQLELPSVKNLRSMFNEEEGASVKRVHSLTGRDLPRVVREKLRDQGPDVVHSSNVRLHDDNRQRPQLRMTLEDSTVHESSIEDETSKAEHLHPRSSTPFGTPKVNVSLEHSRVSTASTPSPNSSRSATRADDFMVRTHKPMKRTAPSPPSEASPPMTESVSFAETNQSAALLSQNRSDGGSATEKQPRDTTQSETASGMATSQAKTGRNSAIMARAAFWDDRILQGKASDKEMDESGFPQLPENSFKSLDEL